MDSILKNHQNNNVKIFKICQLICCFTLLLLISCFGDLEPRYKFENGQGTIANVMESTFEYYLIFKNSEDKIISKHKVGIGTFESGISSAMWDDSKNHFALKMCGEGMSVYIYTYDIKNKLFKEYRNPKQKDIPGWIKFTVKSGFNLPEDVNIDKYSELN